MVLSVVSKEYWKITKSLSKEVLRKLEGLDICIVCLLVLRLNVPVNNFSVMPVRSYRFLGLNQYFGELMSRTKHGAARAYVLINKNGVWIKYTFARFFKCLVRIAHFLIKKIRTILPITGYSISKKCGFYFVQYLSLTGTVVPFTKIRTYSPLLSACAFLY